MLKTPDKEATVDYFRELYQKFGDSYQALDWKESESQKLRFAVLLDINSFTDSFNDVSILDLGCGLGHLYRFLKEEGLLERNRINYTGFDIMPDFIEKARAAYPGVRFEVRDVLEENLREQFDYVFMSGIFNLKFSDKTPHVEFVQNMLKRSYELARRGVAANFLDTAAVNLVPRGKNNEIGRYYFHSPAEILTLSRTITTRYILRADYFRGDFTVYLLKSYG